MFRIIQSIPSPNAEPFKRWPAKVGYERIQEIENPELAAERARQYYRELGYSEDWIAKRLQSIEIRGKLTDEWRERGVQEGIEYSILTAEISRATFGLTPSDYKHLKGLKHENLRDHMTDLDYTKPSSPLPYYFRDPVAGGKFGINFFYVLLMADSCLAWVGGDKADDGVFIPGFARFSRSII